MANIVALCNQALAMIGTRSGISSLAEASAEAQNCNTFAEGVRRKLLRSAPWNFARKFDTLAMLKCAPGTPESTSTGATVWSDAFPPPPWLYTYAKPADSIMIRYILPQGDYSTGGTPIFSDGTLFTAGVYLQRPVKFAVLSDRDGSSNLISVIATNAPQAIACYTIDVEDPEIWDESFEDAFVAALAGTIAFPLTGKRSLMTDMYALADRAIIEARVSDGNEGFTISDNVPDWIRTRGISWDHASSDFPVTAWGPLFSTGGFS